MSADLTPTAPARCTRCGVELLSQFARYCGPCEQVMAAPAHALPALSPLERLVAKWQEHATALSLLHTELAHGVRECAIELAAALAALKERR